VIARRATSVAAVEFDPPGHDSDEHTSEDTEAPSV